MAARRRRLWLAGQWLFAALVVWYAARLLAGQWDEVGDQLRTARIAWGHVAAASGLMLLTYVLLIETWRRVLHGLNTPRLPFADASAIWLASNLGKYVPGKIWSILALGALAKARGIPPLAAGGASVLMQLLSMTTGVLIAAAFGAGAAGAVWAAVGAAMLLMGGLLLAPLLLPRAFALIGRAAGRNLAPPPVSTKALGLAAMATVVAWLGAGIAFAVFAGSLTPPGGAALPLTALPAESTWGAYVAVYAASYVAGFVALFAPGGIGVREGALVATMQGAGLATAPEALVIAVASRIWLTVLEIVPGLLALVVVRRGAA